MKHLAHVCPNGLTAVITRETAHPVVSIQFWVGTGSIHEGEWQGAGLSHLLEHMVFKGTREFSAQQLNEEVAALGGIWNAYTTTDRTVFHIDGPAEHWRKYLHLLAEIVFRPTFPENEWAPERDVIRREMAMCNDDPQDAAYHTLISTLYTQHPRRIPVIGELPRFDALTREDMLAYHRNRYVPGNVFVCVAGDVEAEAFFRGVEEETADIPSRPAAPASIAKEPRQWGPRCARREFRQPTSTLMLGWRVPHARHADAPAIALLSSILGDGRAAWLYKRFHDEQGLVHDISTYPLPDDEGEGALVIEADVEREDRDSVRDALLAYVAELADLPEEAWESGRQRVLRQLRTQNARTHASVQKLAARLGIYWHRFRNPHMEEEWSAALQATTAADIRHAAAVYLTPDRLVETSIDPIGTNPPAEEASGKAQLTPPRVVTLPQGLRLVIREDHRLPLASLTLAFGAGCATETAETAGINNLLAECLLKGTPAHSASELADMVESLGGSINCNAGNNTLSMGARCLAEDVPAMLELMADAALHPLFPEDAVQTAKDDMVADILDSEEDPVSLAFRRLRRLCFGAISYGNHPDGTVESVESLTRDALLAHHARIVCGRNAVLCVAGDINPDAVQPLAESLFASMPEGMPVQRTATPPQQAADVTIPCDKEQAVLALALPGIPADSPDAPLMSLLDEWCRDMGGPVFTEIREKRGLAYYASSSTLYGVDAGCLYFYLGTAPEQLPQAREALEQLLAGLAENGMPETALERSRATALSACLLAAQNIDKLCASSAVDTLLGLGADHIDLAPARFRAVTHEQMQEFIRRVLAVGSTRTWCAVRGE